MTEYRIPSDRVTLIAEIGGNHGGDVRRAAALATSAAHSGADFVKFQTYTADALVNRTLSPDRHAHFRRLELAPSAWAELAGVVADAGSRFMTSLWDPDLLEVVDPLSVAHKIGSGDLTNPRMHRLLAQTGKPLVISTAMSTIAEATRAAQWIIDVDDRYRDPDMLAVLQCRALYDAPTSPDLGVGRIRSLAQALPYATIGYSHHSVGLEGCLLALALGARVIEVHFTDDQTDPSFRDHRLSVNADGLAALRRLADQLPRLLGTSDAPSEDEASMVRDFRRAIFPKSSLPAGTVLTESDLVLLRPQVGIPASELDRVVGKRLLADVEAGQPLSWELLG